MLTRARYACTNIHIINAHTHKSIIKMRNSKPAWSSHTWIHTQKNHQDDDELMEQGGLYSGSNVYDADPSSMYEVERNSADADADADQNSAETTRLPVNFSSELWLLSLTITLTQKCHMPTFVCMCARKKGELTKQAQFVSYIRRSTSHVLYVQELCFVFRFVWLIVFDQLVSLFCFHLFISFPIFLPPP